MSYSPVQPSPMTTDTDLPALLEKFMQQATASNSLYVSHYPTQYRSLRVKVSFGKGTPARVPWLGFFGPGHSPARGSYPAVLYFKAASVLLVAYGASESASEPSFWQPVLPRPLVSDYLPEHFGHAAPRYGSSFAAEGFAVDRSLDLQAVASCIDGVVDTYQELLSRASTPSAALRFGRRW